MHGRTQSGGPRPGKSQKYCFFVVFFSNTGPDLFENHKATKSAFHNGQLLSLFVSSLFPLKKEEEKKTRKKVVRVGPFLAKLSGSAHAMHALLYFCFCCRVVNNFLCLFLMAACGLLWWHFLVIIVYVSIGHIYFLNDDVNF